MKNNLNRTIVIEDIYNAIRLLKQSPRGEYTMEDEFKKLYISNTGIEKIELKPLGKKMMEKFMTDTRPKDVKISEMFGIKVVVSDDVEEWKLE